MAAKGKKKGGKKLSKAEKEKIKQEEAERKARDEEEARRKAEEEAREKEERERREREERVRFEEQERLRQQAEIEELNRIFAEHQENLLGYLKAAKAKRAWDRYMMCDGRPDSLIRQDINTFVTTTCEEPVLNDVRAVLTKSKLIIALVEELKCHAKEISEDVDETHQGTLASYRESMDALLQTLFIKLDELTLNILRNPEGNIDPDSMNIYCSAKLHELAFCVWGNSAKNPRVKSVDFPDIGFSMDLPKQLALVSFAVRALSTSFDQFSQLSRTRQPKHAFHEEIPAPIAVPAVGNKHSVSVAESKLTTADISKGSAWLKQVTHVSSAIPAPTLNSAIKSARSRKSMVGEDLKAASEGKNVIVPDQESSIDDAIRGLQSVAANEDNGVYVDHNVIDLRTFSPVGGILHVELLQLPPQAKQVQSWMMQEVVAPSLRKYQHGKAVITDPESGSLTYSASERSTSSVKVVASNADVRPVTADVPLKITLQCPNNVLYFEAPLVAWWNAPEKNWDVKEILDLKFDAESKAVTFQAGVFGPFAVFQDLHVNMPFQSWEIVPAGIDHCFLIVAAAYIEVTIEIKGELCCLAGRNEIPQLGHLIQNFVPPSALIDSLRWCGVNLFPEEDGAKYVSVTKKNAIVVKGLYKQLSLSASAFASSWSKWNGETDEDTVVLRAMESTCAESPVEDDYRLYKATSRICSLLEMSEYAEAFSPQVAAGSQMHPDLFHMLLDGASERAKQRCRSSSYLFADCVYQLLSATNVFVYS